MRLFTFLLFLTILLSTSCKIENSSSDSQINYIPMEFSEDVKKHWSISSKLPLSLKISTDFSDEERSNIQSMIDSWEGSTATDLFNPTLESTPPFSPPQINSYHDSILGIYKSTQWFADISSQALAVTQFFAYVSTDQNGETYYEIIHADIIVNYRNHDFSLNPEYFNFEYDLPSVILHELGHLLGLGHVYDYSIDSVMHPTLDYAHTKRTLYSKDNLDINTLYQQTLLMMAGNRAINNDLINESREKEMIRGVIELRAKGKCKTTIYPL